jgi:hypothetical protein
MFSSFLCKLVGFSIFLWILEKIFVVNKKQQQQQKTTQKSSW